MDCVRQFIFFSILFSKSLLLIINIHNRAQYLRLIIVIILVFARCFINPPFKLFFTFFSHLLLMLFGHYHLHILLSLHSIFYLFRYFKHFIRSLFNLFCFPFPSFIFSKFVHYWRHFLHFRNLNHNIRHIRQ
jgi:hypothetical protein